MRPDSFVDFCAVQIVCFLTQLPFLNPSLYVFSYLFTSLLVYFLTYLSTLSTIEPFHFQAGGRRRRPNLALVFLCCSIFCYGCMFAFVVFGLVFWY